MILSEKVTTILMIFCEKGDRLLSAKSIFYFIHMHMETPYLELL